MLTDLVGQRLGDRYEIRRELGRGGMGSVFLAQDLLLEREVAVKLLTGVLASSDADQRFRREALVVAKMDHPSIVGIHDLGEHQGAPFLVMPYVEGVSLRARIAARDLTLGEVLEIGAQMALGLDYSHARGVVHRDVKPENVIVARRDGEGLRVRITDFGIALVTSAGDRLTQAGSLIGTAAYLSPEQASGAPVDGRSDVFSLGTVLHECLAGEPPFTGHVQGVLYRIVHEPAPTLRALGVAVPAELEALILRCLTKDPAARPSRAGELAEALQRLAAGLGEEERERTVRLELGRRGVAAATPAPAFVGRHAELCELRARLDAAISGECQLALVGGVIGIGKSRLVEEIEKLARARECHLLHGRFVERASALPYQGFAEMVQEHFRLRRDGGPAVELADLAPELVQLFPGLAELDELRSDTTSERLRTPPEGRPDPTHLFELLARTLARLAGGRPLVLVLHDLHLADVSIEALAYIFRRLGPTPTLLLGTYLSTEIDRQHPLTRLVENLDGDRRFCRVQLQSLSLEEHRQLLGLLTGGAPLGARMTEQIYQATEGNPFFVRELVRTLVDGGTMVRDETGVLTVSGEMDIAAQALPGSVQQAVEQRVERLPDSLRQVLAVAAVLGRSFDYRDLEAVADRGDLDEAVSQLVRRGFLEERREAGRDRLKFSSGVVREVLYAALPRRQRRGLHRRCAELLESRNAGRLERVLPELLEHSIHAEMAEQVVEYGTELARRRLAAVAAEESRVASLTVLQFLDDIGEAEGERAAEVRLLLAAAQRQAGNFEAAIGELDRAARIFHHLTLPDRWTATAADAAECAWRGRRIDDARAWCERGLEVARLLGDSKPLARLLAIAATLANLRGDYELARQLADEVEKLQPSGGERQEEIPRGGRLVVGLPAAVQARHPGQAQLAEEDEVLANVFETLLTLDAEGVVIPHLAAGWRIAGDGREIELDLRPEVRLHDGSALTAADVKRSFETAIRLSAATLPAPFVGLRGVQEFVGGRAGEVAGIHVDAPDRLRLELVEPLPIYPALLTDPWTAIACEVPGDGAARLVGSGPFVLRSLQGDTVVLERNESYWRGVSPPLGAIEFRSWLSAAEMASGLRSGRLDVARDLQPNDLEEILRDRHLRAGLVEAAKKNTYFALFNDASPLGRIAALRMAVCGVVRVHDLVRATLGRFAEPAEGLLPPGILGHDPGRRRRAIGTQDAVDLLRATDLELPITLRAAVHPVYQDRYSSLLDALIAAWAGVGVEVCVETPNMASFMERTRRVTPDLDLLLGRWIADYDDPDNFTFGLFHSRRGRFRSFHTSPALDSLIERARGTDRAAARVGIYRRLEDMLLEDCHLLPLFHEVDYRVAGPRVRGLRLSPTPPYVNYAQLGRADAPVEVPSRRRRGGELELAIPAALDNLDPLVFLSTQWEVVPAVFEALTRPSDSARIVPWLAAEIVPEEGGHRYRVRLRDGVRFHDGRRLHSRDVRYSFERLLRDPASLGRWMLASVRGARDLLRGESDELTGFTVISAREFVVELEQPVAFFPAVLAAVAIVPDGLARFDGAWDEGCVGTGPFRIRRFAPGVQLDLEPSPYYWRPGLPCADGLTFRLGLRADEILAGFENGSLAIAWNLEPGAVELLRADARWQYREVPSLSTYFIACNRRRGPLAQAENRRRLAQALDVDSLVRRTLGRLAARADGLIPPGLLGHESGRSRSRASAPLAVGARPPLLLRGIAHSIYTGAYSAFTDALVAALAEAGIALEIAPFAQEQADAAQIRDADLVLTRWIADYPDADSFVYGVLHSVVGDVGPLVGSVELDAQVDRGRQELAPEVRDGIYRDVEEVLERDGLVVPLFHEQAYRFARPEVRGFEMSLSDPVLAYEALWDAGR